MPTLCCTRSAERCRALPLLRQRNTSAGSMPSSRDWQTVPAAAMAKHTACIAFSASRAVRQPKLASASAAQARAIAASALPVAPPRNKGVMTFVRIASNASVGAEGFKGAVLPGCEGLKW